MRQYFDRMKGGGTRPPRKPLKKVLWSWLGAFAGMYAVASCGRFFGLSVTDSSFLVGSFGASAVLVYGAPLVEFSQPRNLLGGHLFSALIGVTAYKVFGGDPLLAAALAVSSSIAVMHLTSTLHPPGGATALIAVIGGERVHALGYTYAVFPILFGAGILMAVAVAVNNLSRNPKRHYPVYWF